MLSADIGSPARSHMIGNATSASAGTAAVAADQTRMLPAAPNGSAGGDRLMFRPCGGSKAGDHPTSTSIGSPPGATQPLHVHGNGSGCE